MSNVIEKYNILYVLIKYEHRYDNIRKIGCTNNLPRRKFEYKTGNLYPVKFEGYFKIPTSFNIFKIEKTVHRDLEDIGVYYNGGREFFQFKTNSIEIIKNILLNYDITAILVEGDDIIAKPSKSKKEELEYCNFQSNKIFGESEEYPKIFKIDKPKTLRYYQSNGLEIMKNNVIGKLILPTGAGKTVIFLEYLFHKIGLLLIIVPTIILVDQTYKKAKEKGFKNVYRIYSKSKDIINLSKQETEPVLIVTTYQSSGRKTNKLLEYNYETIIFDECHRTSLSTISKELKCFQKFLNHKNTKEKFFFTATEKNVNADDLKEDEFISSMSNNNLYGNELFRYPYSQAITEGYLCDYNIDIIISSNKETSLINYLNKRKGYKTLIYCSSCENSKNVKDFLDENKIRNVFYLDSSSKNKQKILKDFKKNDERSILVLCKMCIVGFDEPQIDNVMHYDITKSTIELSQKNGRALRLYTGKQRAILTFFVTQDDKSEEANIKKCMAEMIRNDPRLEAEANRVKDKKNKGEIHSIDIKVESKEDINGYNSYSTTYDRYVNLICYNDTKLSYLEVKEIIKSYNIKTKEKYFKTSEKDFRLPEKPDEYFKGKFDWIDYLSINKEDYFTLKECKKYSIEYLEKNPELKNYYLLEPSKITRTLSKINNKFPPHDLWCEIYGKGDIKDIIKKRTKKKLSDF
jgi:superfamily II DNA or RNA helicase